MVEYNLLPKALYQYLSSSFNFFSCYPVLVVFPITYLFHLSLPFIPFPSIHIVLTFSP